MTTDELMGLGLSKWPQMIVTGTTLPEEQALEIIRRTDRFFSWPSGNNHPFIKEAVQAVKMPQRPKGDDADTLQQYWSADEAWKKKWGLIETEYVTNSWVSCSFVGGPHGWCHPDGTIGFADNVGKWPSVEEIYNDWALLAKEFPFLELEVTLMDRESCEESAQPVVSMLIRNGAVELVDPRERDLHAEFGRTKEQPKDMLSCVASILSGFSDENAISMNQLRKWGTTL